MKVIYNRIIPWGFASYVNLFGVIFTRQNNLCLNELVKNHELIHTRQMKYMLYLPFYAWYLVEYFIKFIISLCYYRQENIIDFAYRSISFEQEAYYNDDNMDYLKSFNPYAWIKYIFTMYDKTKNKTVVYIRSN